MKQKIYQTGLSALVYFLLWAYADLTLILPENIVNFAIFLPPVVGLMWGLPGVIGVCIGGLLSLIMTENDMPELMSVVRMTIWLFTAGYLPYFMWHNWRKDNQVFLLTVETLQKLVIIFCVTFLITSILRTIIAPASELETVAVFFGKRYAPLAYAMVCFISDVTLTLFFDLVLIFVLISQKFRFANSADNLQFEHLNDEEHKALRVSVLAYLIFPAVLTYLDVNVIYGMNQIETWVNFTLECQGIMDIYFILVIYLLLRYRRSIMMEIVFLLAMTVFLSSAVLGWGSSVAISRVIDAHVNDSLHAMSVICRERLDRTFFCVRQAVNSMEDLALGSLESYDRLVNDADYRKTYLAQMKNHFHSIAVGIDGSVSYYYRFKPEIEGTKGGFSMQREDARWEGTLSPFMERQPIDLAPYSPDDIANAGWYYIPYRSKTATWIEPYVDAVTNFYVISYVAPLFVEGKFIGVVGMDIDFNFIIQELRRMSIYNYGYVYMMDRNNIILYHKDRFQGSIFQHNPEFKEMEIFLTNGMWLGVATPLSKVNEPRNRTIMHLVAAIFTVAMLVSVGSIVLVSKAIKPLAGMTEAAKRIASGDLNVKISYESGNELGLLVRSIREMATKLEAYVYRDKLTGLRNAAAYISRGTELDNQAKVIPELAYGVILFDVNFLKKVNDQHGHQAGNQLLRHASRVICKVFEHSPVYRVGGDEFVAILEGEDYENKEQLLEVFDEKIALESFEVAGETIFVSVARGLAIYESGMEFAAVAKKADVAMYNHKAAIKAKYGEEVR